MKYNPHDILIKSTQKLIHLGNGIGYFLETELVQNLRNTFYIFRSYDQNFLKNPYISFINYLRLYYNVIRTAYQYIGPY